MNKTEYWLLDLVAERSWFALEWLVSGECQRSLESTGHHLPRSTLIDALHRLFQRGSLVAQQLQVSPYYKPHEDTFIPTLAQIRAALAGEIHLAYALTARGGAHWERYARPEWNRYIACTFTGEHHQEGTLAGADYELVRYYLGQLPARWNASLVPDSEEWDMLMPWEATYWKVLPRAHRVRFRITWRHLPEPLISEAVPLWKQPQTDTIGQWYRPCFP
jgi:hypothetical protein